MKTALALLLLATTLSAADLKIDPVAPNDRDSIRITAIAEGCGTIAPEARVEGSTIIVDAHFVPAGQCTQVPNSVFTVVAGPLPSGVYEVETHGTLHPTRARILVRPTLPRVAPAAVPITGGSVTIEDLPRSPAPSVVSVDGVIAKILPNGYIEVPPHAAGTVDVAITANGVTRIIRAGLTYFDPNAPADPQVFERLLFPIAFDGPGAFGTQWRTSNLYAYTNGVWLRDPPCGGFCPTDGDGRDGVRQMSPAGVFLYAIRGGAEIKGMSSIRDLTRNPAGIPTTVPVAHESDFKESWTIYSVPVDPQKYRTTLRVWSLDRPLKFSVFFGASFFFQGHVDVQTSDSEPHFAQVDLTAALKGAPVTIINIGATAGTFERSWAMVSVTNNVTQEVTIVTPP
jgi:hypothetical protein